MKLILACDPNGGIGYKNKLPWDKIQGDLPRFKRLTDGGVVVMGRNTWESLPKKPLPNRVNVIISKTMNQIDDAIVLPNIGRLKDAHEVWVIGGSSLIKSVWNDIHEIHLTLVLAEYTCDTFIDLVKLKEDFVQVTGSGHGDHSYEVWKRR
jgi:dihydrofolate reductase